jgi:acetyltransferase-like isoleucine patch superfamily enzyme
MPNDSKNVSFTFFRTLISLMKADISSRTWGVLLQYLASIFPDIFCFNFIRVWALYFAGARFKSINTVVIRRGVFIEYPKNMYFGKGVQVNRNTYFASNDKIEIGDYTRFAINVQVVTVGHEGRFNEVDTLGPIKIGSGCWIGSNSLILKNVTIGDFAIIGAGSIVNKNIPDSVIAAGVPAVVVRNRENI